MRCDLIATLETSPRLTEVQIRQLFDKIGDEPYQDCVDAVRAGGGSGSKSPATVQMQLDRPDRDRKLGIRDETAVFLKNALEVRGIDIVRLDFNIVPKNL